MTILKFMEKISSNSTKKKLSGNQINTGTFGKIFVTEFVMAKRQT